MMRKAIAVAFCIMMGTLLGCSSIGTAESSTQETESIAETVMDTTMTDGSEIDSVTENSLNEEKNQEDSTAEIYREETESVTTDETTILEDIEFTYLLPKGIDTWELDAKTKGKIADTVRYIGDQWEEAITGDVYLKDIRVLVMAPTIDGKEEPPEVRGFILHYLTKEQSDADYRFQIGMVEGKPLQILKFTNGPSLSDEEEIPINPEIQ